jgi:hypothetical protein
MATILVMVSFAFAGLRSGPQGRAEPLAGWMRVADNVDRVAGQINRESPRTHHDALEFPDGRVVLLTDLFEGQEATVLQLPAQPATAPEAKPQARVLHAVTSAPQNEVH